MSENAATDHLRFLRGLIARPRNVGAIAPSSPALARAMAAQIDPAIDGPVLELGPGTGAITEALIARPIAPARITAIEYDPEFAGLVAARFPGIHVVRGDAFDFLRTLGLSGGERFAAIVSGLPLLNHPPERRHALVENILTHLAPGAPYIQFSYGLQPPVAAPTDASVKRAAFIMRNLPPARVWVYRRA